MNQRNQLKRDFSENRFYESHLMRFRNLQSHFYNNMLQTKNNLVELQFLKEIIYDF